MENMLDVLEPEASKYKIHVIYLMLKCDKCGRTWGTNLIEGKVKETSLVCSSCALKRMVKDS